MKTRKTKIATAVAVTLVVIAIAGFAAFWVLASIYGGIGGAPGG